MTKKRRLMILLLPALAVVLVFHPIMLADFAFDDAQVITEELKLDGFPDLFRVLSPFHAKDLGEATWRPLLTLSYVAVYALFGDDPAAHHAVDLFLHATVSLLLSFLLFRLGLSPFSAAVGAMIFALHPLVTGTVAMISFREEALTAVMGLAALLLLSSGRKPGLRAIGYLLIAGAPFVKETGAAFGPACAMLGNKAEKGRRTRTIVAVLLALASVVILVAINHATGGFALAEKTHLGLLERMDVAGDAVAAYLRRLVLWRDLSPIHDDLPKPSAPGAAAIFGLGVLVMLVAAIAAGLRRPGLGPLAAALVFFPLFPTLNLVFPFWIKQADRFCYMPLLGLGILAAVATERLGSYARERSDLLKVFAWASPVALILILAVGSWREVPRYANSMTLFASVVARQPGSDNGKLFLAQELVDAGRVADATRLLIPVYRRHSRNLKTAGTMAECWVLLGQPEKAVKILEGRVLEGRDGTAAALTLQAAYFSAGRYEDGMRLTESWATRPELKPKVRIPFFSNAAQAAANLDHRTKALELARRGLALKADSPALLKLVAALAEGAS